MPEPTDTITVDGTTYYRAGGGWRMRGARDVAVGPRICALLNELAQLREALDAARQDAARWQWVTQFMSVESDATKNVEYLFMDDLRVSDTVFVPAAEHSVDSLVDAYRDAQAARAAEGGTPDA